jgi:hypothetical protein
VEGVTRNASRSGVLFECALALDVGTPVELVLGLSLEGGRPSEAADMMCEGRNVRAQSGSTAGAAATLAATITSYSYLRTFSGRRL